MLRPHLAAKVVQFVRQPSTARLVIGDQTRGDTANNHDVDALEALTSTLTDSINGYEEAAEVASDTGISSFLRQKARERRGVTSEFRSKITSLGGNSKVSGSASAALHRRFLDLRSMFQNNTKAAIAEVERGERYLKERFETYMADQNLSASTRDLIRSTYERVRFDHARWDQLKRVTERSTSIPSHREMYGRRRESSWSDMADSGTVMALAIGAGLGLLAGSLVSTGSSQPSRTHWQGNTGRRWPGSSSRRTSSVERDETTDLIASNKVEGTAVYDRQGKKLGEVYNFMVGKRSGRVAYAVMSFGGLLGMAAATIRCRGARSITIPREAATSWTSTRIGSAALPGTNRTRMPL